MSEYYIVISSDDDSIPSPSVSGVLESDLDVDDGDEHFERDTQLAVRLSLLEELKFQVCLNNQVFTWVGLGRI